MTQVRQIALYLLYVMLLVCMALHSIVCVCAWNCTQKYCMSGSVLSGVYALNHTVQLCKWLTLDRNLYHQQNCSKSE